MIVEAGAADFAALLDGGIPGGCTAASEVAPPEMLAMLANLAAAIRPGFAPSAWLVVEQGRVLGLCSLVKPPADGVATIGYGIAADHWGQGAATRAVAEIVAWAQGDARLHSLAAETGTENRSSQIVLERNGFAISGRRHDAEDGDLLCWSRDVA